MDLARYLEILKRRKWVIISTVLAALMVASVGARLQDPTYSAAATVRVAQASQGSVEYSDYVYAERLMNTYAVMLKSWPVLREVAQRLGVDLTPEALEKQIKIEILLNTELLRISVEDQNPVLARDIANGLAAVLVEQGQSYYFGGVKSAREILQEQMAGTRSIIEEDRAAVQAMLDGEAPWDGQRVDDLNRKIRLEEEMYAELSKKYEEVRLTEAARANSVTIVEPAITPERPARPRLSLLLLVGAALGLIGGVGLAFLLESLDPTLHTTADLERVTAVPVLAAIPRVSWPKTVPLAVVVAGSTDSPLGEAFRFLRTNMLLPASGTEPRTVLVTSAEPGVGKSTVLVNLAATVAQGGAKVVVVDADLRRPSLHQAFHIVNDQGLSGLLRSRVTAASLLRDTPIAHVKALTSGPALLDPAEALSQSRMRDVIQELTQTADMVLLDSPPVLAVADAAILAPLVDGVVIVVGCDRTPRSHALRSLQQIESVGGKPLGFVFNQIRIQDQYYPRYYRSLTRVEAWASAAGANPARVRLPLWMRALRGLVIAVTIAAASFILVAGAQQHFEVMQPPSVPARDTAQAGLLPPETSTPTESAAAAGSAPAELPTVVSPPVQSHAAAATGDTNGGSQLVTSLTPDPASISTISPVATPSQLARQGMIRYRSIYLYQDPHDPESTIFLIPANWQVLILEDNVPGATIDGNSQWSRVRITIRGDFFEGYVIGRYIEEIQP
jgi:polysaccharide biosynthesis transport protein